MSKLEVRHFPIAIHHKPSQLLTNTFLHLTRHTSQDGPSVCLLHPHCFLCLHTAPSKKLIISPPGATRLGGLSQAETRELEQRMQKRQVKEFVGVRTPPLAPWATISCFLSLQNC